MLRISQRLAEPRSAGSPRAEMRLVLPFELRSRSRFRARLVGGEEVGVVLPRGQILRGGDLLLTDDGRVVEVGAAPEWVSTLHAQDARLLARVAYPLGNTRLPFLPVASTRLPAAGAQIETACPRPPR